MVCPVFPFTFLHFLGGAAATILEPKGKATGISGATLTLTSVSC